MCRSFLKPDVSKLLAKKDKKGLIKALRYGAPTMKEGSGIRQDAARALGTLGDPVAVGPLLDLIDQDRGNACVISSAVEAVGNLGGFNLRVFIALSSAAKDAREDVREAAWKAQAKLGTEGTLSPLVRTPNGQDDSTVNAMGMPRYVVAWLSDPDNAFFGFYLYLGLVGWVLGVWQSVLAAFAVLLLGLSAGLSVRWFGSDPDAPARRTFLKIFGIFCMVLSLVTAANTVHPFLLPPMSSKARENVKTEPQRVSQVFARYDGLVRLLKEERDRWPRIAAGERSRLQGADAGRRPVSRFRDPIRRSYEDARHALADFVGFSELYQSQVLTKPDLADSVYPEVMHAYEIYRETLRNYEAQVRSPRSGDRQP